MRLSRRAQLGTLQRNRSMLSRQCAAILMTVLLCTHLPVAYSADKPTRGKNVELHWSELGAFIAQGQVKTVLPDGTVLKGRSLAVNEDALVLNVQKSSNKETHPEGRTAIPRDQIKTLSLTETKGAVGRIVLTLVGVFGGSALGFLVGALATDSYESTGAGVGSVVGMIGGGVGGYYTGRGSDRKTAMIKLLPD